MKETHEGYVNKMLVTSHMGNMDQVIPGYHSLPQPYNNANGLEIKMCNLNGNIMTPWFGENYIDKYYKQDRDYHVKLELPDIVKEKSGSLFIDLDMDTREEPGWIENISIFTFHKTTRDWFQAEAECQRIGGHIVTVTSEEENDLLESLAGDLGDFWLGGRKDFKEWLWVNNFTWGFTRWAKDQPKLKGNNSCAVFKNNIKGDSGQWYDSWCDIKFQFICNLNNAKVSRQRLNLAFRKVTFSSFHIVYKYKAADEGLLNSWKDKRMTGFKIKWRIEDLPLVANIKEVGRSLKTPGKGEIIERASLGRFYKATLNVPKDVQKKVGNGSLVIELDVQIRPSDKLHAFTDFKLIKEDKTWNDADIFCKSKGGHLASIHSKWEQEMADTEREKGGRCRWAWIGGQKNNQSQWQWTDNSTWTFTNWLKDRPLSSSFINAHIIMRCGGHWYDFPSYWDHYFLCQAGNVVLTENGLHRIALNEKQLAFSPYYVLFETSSASSNLSNFSNDSNSSAAADVTSSYSGFSLDWFLVDSNGTRLTEKLPPGLDDWEQESPAPKYKNSLSDMVNLARHYRLQNMTEKDILERVIQNKVQNIKVVEDMWLDKRCIMDQVITEMQAELFSKLDPPELTDGPPTEDDIRVGHKLFHAIIYCPSANEIRLYRFVYQLLATESQRTVIQTLTHLVRLKPKTDEKSLLPLLKKFYKVMASTLNLQHGNVLLATLTNAQLEDMISNEWPFFANNSGVVGKCLTDKNCDTLQASLRELGEYFVSV